MINTFWYVLKVIKLKTVKKEIYLFLLPTINFIFLYLVLEDLFWKRRTFLPITIFTSIRVEWYKFLWYKGLLNKNGNWNLKLEVLVVKEVWVLYVMIFKRSFQLERLNKRNTMFMKFGRYYRGKNKKGNLLTANSNMYWH